jgi:hypothetical protein
LFHDLIFGGSEDNNYSVEMVADVKCNDLVAKG